VTAADAPWVHALLLAVGARVASGLPLLINTSFNTKGRPIINRVREGLTLMCNEPDLEFVVAEDASGDHWLIERARMLREGVCDDGKLDDDGGIPPIRRRRKKRRQKLQEKPRDEPDDDDDGTTCDFL